MASQAHTPDLTRPRRRFTVEAYHSMVEAGVLGPDDRVELIGGEIVEKPALDPQYAACIQRLHHFLQGSLGDVAAVRVRLPITIPDYDEPDVAVVKPDPHEYDLNHPTPSDLLHLIEVALSSAAYDRDVKLPLYARAGVPEFWLVDLKGDSIERRSAPDPDAGIYRSVAHFQRGEVVSSTILPQLMVLGDTVWGRRDRG
ncbi:MAG: Uma2 family endonuclease [Chloroflexia bacterium]